MAKGNKKETEKKAAAAQGIGPVSFRLKNVTKAGASGVLQNVRLAFVYLKEPQVDKANPAKAAYRATALIPSADFKAVYAEIMDAVKQAVALSVKITDKDGRMAAFKQAGNTGQPKALFKDGEDVTDKTGAVYDGFAGHMTLAVKHPVQRDESGAWSSRVPVRLEDKSGRIVEKTFADREFYSGCYAHLAVTFATYDAQGSKGVTVYLNAVRKAADAERLGASNPFADIAPIEDAPSGMMSDDDISF